MQCIADPNPCHALHFIFITNNQTTNSMTKLLRLTLVAVLMAICGTANAQTVFNFKTLYEGIMAEADKSITLGNHPQTVNDITISFAKGNGSAPSYYKNKTSLRLYAPPASNASNDGNTVTVKCEKENIKRIELTASPNSPWPTITASTGTVSEDASHNLTWTGDAAEVTFTMHKPATTTTSTGQARYTEATVYLISDKIMKEADLKFSTDKVECERGKAFTAPTFSKATTATVTFTSDNENVAKVDANGTITLGDAEGTAVITATAEANADYLAGTATCTVSVYHYVNYKKATSITPGKKYLLVAQDGTNTWIGKTITGANLTYVYYDQKIAKNVDETKIKSNASLWYTINTFDDGYSILNAFGKKYMSHTTTDTSGKFMPVEEETKLSITPNTDGTFTITSEDGYTIYFSTQYQNFCMYSESNDNTILPTLFECQESTDGINGITTTETTKNGATYNLAGQRVSESYKGIVIINGKKRIQ